MASPLRTSRSGSAREFTALLGPNGAGKTTLFSLITRLFEAPRGKISVCGINLRERPTKALAHMGVVFQQPTLDLDLTVRQNLHYFASSTASAGATPPTGSTRRWNGSTWASATRRRSVS